MEEREKDILRTVAEALPHMSDFEKGYMLGMAESRASKAEEEERGE